MASLILTIGLNLFLLLDSGNVTLESFFQHECEMGKQSACERVQQLDEASAFREILNARSEHYWESVDTDKLMLDTRRPDLQSTYPLVMQDFIQSEIAAGYDLSVREEWLPDCARHYHNHWVNKKLWWPANDDGKPDWPSIYVYIVDHYYGYCLKQQ